MNVCAVSFGSNMRPRNFVCIAMGSVVYFEVQIALIFCRESASCFV